MRVLEVTESFATGTMGIVQTISEYAAQRGHDVAIAYGVRPETPDALRGLVAREVDLISLPWTSRTAAAQLRAMRALRKVSRRWRPDVIHLHSSFAGFVGSLAIASSAPTVYTPHGYSFLGASSPLVGAGYRMAERVTARRVSMIGAVSEAEAWLARGLGARRVEVIPNGIPELDAPLRRDSTTEQRGSRPLVVTVGRIVAARQPTATARILKALDGVADVLWIGGPGPDEAETTAVLEMGIPVTGWLDRDAAVERLSSATALLNWSAWDSHPLAVLEALAFDVAVIGSDIEANRELVGESQVCGTEADAVRLLRDLLTDPERRAEMLANQRERRQAFGAARMASDWLRIYERLVTGASSSVRAPLTEEPAGN